MQRQTQNIRNTVIGYLYSTASKLKDENNGYKYAHTKKNKYFIALVKLLLHLILFSATVSICETLLLC